jgi:hypothetical protein
VACGGREGEGRMLGRPRACIYRRGSSQEHGQVAAMADVSSAHSGHASSFAAIHRTGGRCYSSDFGRQFLASSFWIRILVTVSKFLPAQCYTCLIKGS